ncbi:MAG TPA: diphthine--ammonia ligase [Candidatus Bilamarchaeaceae archaeon]|nr:diphthine--ammonia ligase [Candidatus Bilamarchaeaceae archaeon]
MVPILIIGMKVACLFSGGKDSCFSLFWAIAQGFEPFLITVKAEEDSTMFHHPNIEKTKLQTEAIGIEQHFLETNENEWHEELKVLLKKTKAEGIVSGALASEYQRRRIERVGEELDIPTYAPLWHKEDVVLEEMLQYFEIYVTSVSAEGLGKELLGKPLKKLINKKVKGIHPLLEGGEGETFVSNAPFFKKKLEIKRWEIKWDGIRGTAEIKNS